MSKVSPNIVEQTENMQKEIKYLNSIVQLNEMREKVYGLNMQVFNSMKENVDKVIQYLDAGVKKNEIYKHLGWNDNEAPTEEINTDLIEEQVVS